MFRRLFADATLTVLSGLYEGASERLAARRFSVGSGIDNPVVLTGSALAPAHFQVERPAWPLSRLRVRALEGPVRINGRTRLSPGQWTKVKRASVLEAAGHRFILAQRLGLIWPLLALISMLAVIAAAAMFVPWPEAFAALRALLLHP
jgi:hypothetical protein